MADYNSPTVIQQEIPVIDMTTLEILLLTNIFEAETNDEKLFLSAYESPGALIWVDRVDLEIALEAPENAIYPVTELRAQMEAYKYSKSGVMLDVSIIPWEEMLQNIVKRSSTLKYISVVTSYTCSKMRPDGWGGYVTLITPTMFRGRGTDEILGELLDEADIEATKHPRVLAKSKSGQRCFPEGEDF